MPKKGVKGKVKTETQWTPREKDLGDDNNRSVFHEEEESKQTSKTSNDTPTTPGEPLNENEPE